ncbi:MAG: efflux RND transporter permease subunit, partial [Hyphomicrobiaceae bacterium]
SADAARATMDEVGTAVISIALVLSAVFIPTAFVSGITGQFYRQFAITIASATIISAFVSLTLSPALAAILFKGHHEHAKPSVLMKPVHILFNGFNRGFAALAAGYSALVRTLARVTGIMLVIYAGLIAGAIGFVMYMPTGFIPALDRGIVIVSLQLPAGASLERTDAVVRKAQEIIHATPGFKYTNGYTGRSGSTFTNGSNLAAIFCVLDDFLERHHKGLTVNRVAQDLRDRLAAEINDATAQVFVPPPVRGVGGTSGFSMRLQDRVGLGSEAFSRAAQDLIQAANSTPGIINTFTTFSTGTPQIFVDVDRMKAQMLKVPMANVFEAMRVYMGSAYVNDFNMFGRTYRVTAQADSAFRLDPENISRIRVRNTDGQMVPMGSLVTFREITGPDRVPRYNLFPTIEINGQSAAGVSSGQSLEIMQTVAARTLPPGVAYEWTDLSYQEKKTGRTGYYIFALSVLFVFLALAAQYESWSLPFAIILIVPMCLLSAVFGVWLHGQDINILTQVSFVVLIGLAAKNAVLIVEFARQLEDKGHDIVSAAVEACKLRLRPILMTSMAFASGVLPLYFAKGAGAEMRIALGTGVFWGMIGVTLFGLIFTPVFYVVMRKLATRKRAGAVTAPQPAE